VIRALAEADHPLRAREIHSAAQDMAGTPLNWNTVNDCLHTNVRRPESPKGSGTGGARRAGPLTIACVVLGD